MMPSEKRVPKTSGLARAIYLVKSDFGRADGWQIELDGRAVGRLTDPFWEDQFWHSYAVTANTEDEAPLIRDDQLWSESKFAFRSLGTGETVTYAFCGGGPPFVREGRILMRRLYLLPNSRLEGLWLTMLQLLPTRRA